MQKRDEPHKPAGQPREFDCKDDSEGAAIIRSIQASFEYVAALGPLVSAEAPESGRELFIAEEFIRHRVRILVPPEHCPGLVGQPKKGRGRKPRLSAAQRADVLSMKIRRSAFHFLFRLPANRKASANTRRAAGLPLLDRICGEAT